MQDVAELIEHRQRNRPAHLLQVLSNLSCKTDGNFNAIVRRLMKEKKEDLGGCHLMDDLLIAKVCDEGGGGNTDGFVVPLECFPKLDDQSGEEQFANLR